MRTEVGIFEVAELMRPSDQRAVSSTKLAIVLSPRAKKMFHYSLVVQNMKRTLQCQIMLFLYQRIFNLLLCIKYEKNTHTLMKMYPFSGCLIIIVK